MQSSYQIVNLQDFFHQYSQSSNRGYYRQHVYPDSGCGIRLRAFWYRDRRRINRDRDDGKRDSGDVQESIDRAREHQSFTRFAKASNSCLL